MSYGIIVMDHYPVVELRIHNMEPTFREIDDFFDELECELEKREGPYVTKVYGQGNFISSQVRSHLGKRSNLVIDRFRSRAKGAAIINASPIGRMMINGLWLLVKQPVPMRMVASEKEADKLAMDLLGVEAKV